MSFRALLASSAWHYAELAAGRSRDADWVPLLSEASSLAGFPDGTTIGTGDGEPLVAAAPVAGASERLCLAAADPLVAAAGTMLARASGRALRIAEDLLEALAAALVGDRLQSLTILLPGWDKSGRVDGTQVHEMVAQLRRIAAPGLAWGILTGPSPGQFARNVARAVLARPILHAYDGAPELLVAEPETLATIPDNRLLWTAPLPLSDPAAIAARRWSSLLFKGHGRSYCALGGLLCGARPLDEAWRGQPVAHCINGLDCANSAFPRFDPRLFDARIAIADCCSASSPFFAGARAGGPTIAFHLLAGATSAVFGSDVPTIGHAEDAIDWYWALAGAASLGVVAVRINAARTHAGPPLAYWLLGDPETPPPAARLAERGRRTAAPFVVLKGGEPSNAVLFSQEDVPLAGRVMPDGDIWISTGTIDAPQSLAVAPAPELPRAVVAGAEAVIARSYSWLQPLDRARAMVQDAAGLVLAIACDLGMLGPLVLPGPPDRLAGEVERGIAHWRTTQLNALRCAIEDAAPGGLWPPCLWLAYLHRSRLVDGSCPYCGVGPLIERRYRSNPGSLRVELSCHQCELLSDRPETLAIHVVLHQPEKVMRGTSLPVTLTLTPADTVPHEAAVAILIDGHGQIVESDPVVQWTAIDASPVRLETAIRIDHASNPHLYRVRALILIDGEWLLASRSVTIGQEHFATDTDGG